MGLREGMQMEQKKTLEAEIGGRERERERNIKDVPRGSAPMVDRVER